MLAKQLFRLFAIISSCHTISLFFTSIILLLFRPLLKKEMIYCFTEFCVVRNTFDSNITNIFFFGLEKFPSYNYPSFHQTFFLLKLFLHLGLRIIAFLRHVVIKALLLKRRTFILTGAILFKTSRNTASKLEYCKFVSEFKIKFQLIFKFLSVKSLVISAEFFF